MREIKFKVWCKNLNEWEKDLIVLFPGGTFFELKGGRTTPLKKENHIPVFFTGLLDKNGKEIYEGDVVMTKDLYKCKVVWDLDFARYQIIYPGGMLDHIPFDCEVIGNTFENPDLLTSHKA